MKLVECGTIALVVVQCMGPYEPIYQKRLWPLIRDLHFLQAIIHS